MSNVIDIFTLHFGMVFHICKYETKMFDQITHDEMEISNLNEFFITFLMGKMRVYYICIIICLLV
jgi:hypothetical protein